MNRGGKRKGSGRKALPDNLKKQPCPIKLRQWLIDKLDSLPDSRAVEVEKALIKAHGWTDPTIKT